MGQFYYTPNARKITIHVSENAMKKKSKLRLPNSYGTIRFLGSGRSNPYAVHPPATYDSETKTFIRPKALCYVDDWYVGFAVLNAYHAGRYKPGDELDFKAYKRDDPEKLNDFCKRILADYCAREHIETLDSDKTFADVYKDFIEWKYGQYASRTYSDATKCSDAAGYKLCTPLYTKPFASLRHADLQNFINTLRRKDGEPLKGASLNRVLTLIRQMYKYAITFEIVDQDYSANLRQPMTEPITHGTPLWDDELHTLWNHADDPAAATVLIMCYSGFRAAAYKTLEVNTQEWYFRGGVKTQAGKDRIVPIHTAIRPLVLALLPKGESKFKWSYPIVSDRVHTAVDMYKLPYHHPHDCRHTFSRLCEQYEVAENDRKRMLGHSFGADISNQVYGHRTLDDLRTQIEKIKAPI